MDLFRPLRGRLSGLDNRLEKSEMLLSIRKGLTLSIPFLLIGSIALIVTSLPVPAYQKLLTALFGPHWQAVCDSVFSASFGILSIIMTLTVSYSYASGRNGQGPGCVNPLIAALVSLCSLLTLSGFGASGFSLAAFGTTGLFSALLVSALSSKLFVALSRMKRFRVESFTDGANSAFNDSVSAMVPALLTIALFASAGLVLVAAFGVRDIQHLTAGLSTALFRALGYSIWSALLFVLLIHGLWLFGIHGSNVLEPVAQGFFAKALPLNQQLVAHHLAPFSPFTKSFFDTFVLMGGCGSALCLVLAIFIRARHRNLRRLAKLALVPVLFNVNELIVFGLPIVLNPVYLIPFVATPLLLTLVAFAATAAGLVPHTTQEVAWTTPVLLGGWQATGSVAGGLLQVVNLALGTLCYLPFVRLAEQRTQERMKRTLAQIGDTLEQPPESRYHAGLLSRRDDQGLAARVLAADLELDLDRGGLSLFYQPQVDEHGAILGLEALLRWKHDLYGFIAPPIAIALAEESRLFGKLDAWITDTACRQMRALLDQGITLTMSINTTAPQLEGEALYANLKRSIARYGIPPGLLKIEVTENDALSASNETLEHMAAIHELGLKFAMDDFGMGHTSILYLKEYPFDTVKIDGSLIKALMTNPACGEIIASIVTLGKSLGFTVIAEYVETDAQRDKLKALGCSQYQGYLYSRALPGEELAGFIHQHRSQQVAIQP